MDLSTLKGWIEELIAKKKILETENETLKQKNQSLVLENQKLMNEMSTLNESSTLEHRTTVSTVNSETYEVDDEREKELITKYMLRGSSEAMSIFERIRHDLREEPIHEDFPTANPLMMPEVVRIMMDFVQLRDLVSCRCVCKLWKLEASRQIQEKHKFKLSFFYNDKVIEFLDHAAVSFPTFRNVHINLKGSDGPPNSFNTLLMRHGKSLHHVELQFGYDQNLSMDNFRDLLLASLDEIRTLKIEGLRCLLIHDARVFGPNHTMKILPYLTSVNIEMIHPCIQNHRDTEVFVDLLRVAPNLKTLHWKSKPQSDLDSNGTRTMLESLLQVNPSKFENLFLHSPVSTPLLSLLANCNLKLTQLYFTELQGFEVLFSTAANSETNISPKRVCYSRIPAMDLKRYLENRLAESGQVHCTSLLKTFLTALVTKLAEG